MKIEIEIKGTDELRRILSAAGPQAPRAIAGPLYRFVRQYVLLPAKQRFVPVVDSALKNSIQIEAPTINGSVVTVTIGAGGQSAPYAAAVHENPRSGKTGGIPPGGLQPLTFRWIGGKIRPIGGPYRRYSRVGQWKYLEQPAKEAAAHLEPLIQDVRREVEKLFGRR
jgi:hypothetical protein